MANYLFLDMDPGIDDAAALMMISAYNNKWKIAGISALSGNVEVEKTAENALKIADIIGLECDVYKGASRPLIKKAHAAYKIHGRDGLGDSQLKHFSKRLSDEYGPVAMIKAAKKYVNIWVLATGPLTDIAIATILEPNFPKMIGGLVVMGGAFNLNKYGGGNQTRYAEFNIWADPEAADIVFKSYKYATIIGLDVTANPQTWIKREEIVNLKKTRRSGVLHEITKHHIDAYGAFVPHDPIAAYYLIEPDNFETEEHCIKVNLSRPRGRTSIIEPLDDCNKVKIATYVNSKSFKGSFFNAMETE